MEWHFADFERLSAKEGRSFDCATCKPEVQKSRRCHEPGWSHEPGKALPVVLVEGTPGIPFCPSKLMRDDPEFCAEMDALWLAWQMGQVHGAPALDRMHEDQQYMLSCMIRGWQNMQRREDFVMLGRLLGGDGKE